MVRGALFKKLLRDMNKSKAQFISIFIMATLATSIMTGLDSIWFTVENNANAMYQSTNMSVLWVTVMNPSEQNFWGIKQIDGVTHVEKRFSMDVDTNLPKKATLHLYALDEGSILDQPVLQEGRFSKSSKGVVLDSSFAKAHNLKVGDSISIKLNDVWIRLPIEGLALSSEQVYSVKNTASVFPDPSTYGFLMTHTSVLEKAYGQKIYNQISVKTEPGANLVSIVQKVDKVIGNKLIGITLQENSVSVNSVNGRIQQFKALALVFPLLFFLVTALITQSTMVRLIESQRTQIGILKALGYSKLSILWHYTSYGIMIGVLGSLAGLMVGVNVFGKTLVPRLKLMLSSFSFHINFRNFLIASLLILICTGGISFHACWKLQGDTPAVLLREKNPQKGNRIFMELIPSFWGKIKFSSKLIARNTMKNKVRLIMSIIGVTGCVGVILAALTVRTTLVGISDQLYGDTFTYEQKVLVDSTKTNSYYLRSLGLNGITQQIQESAIEIILPSGEHKMEPITVTTKDSPMIHMKDPEGEPVAMPDNGILMTRKLGKILGVEQGDIIQIKRSGKGYTPVQIVGVIFMTSNQGIYMSDTFWESLGETFSPTGLLIKWNGTPNQRFLARDFVVDSATRESLQTGLDSNMEVINFAVVALILMGASLAFVVLYNTSILNFVERIRDLATLRVLGFHYEEIHKLVLVENYFSVVLGIVLGTPVGRFMSWVITSTLDDNMDLTGNLVLPDVLITVITTLCFAWLINRVVAKKMQEIDMLEALKSVE